MYTENRRKEILESLSQAVVEFNEEQVVKYSLISVKEDLDAYDAIINGLAAGMEVVADLYDKQEYFVPELLMCTDALYKGLEILKPHIKRDTVMRGQVVIGSVRGDVHDIGKNFVKIMFEVGGFTVHDLGKDVPLEDFVSEQLRTDSEIVALSAQMTNTALGMKTVVHMVKENNPRAAIMLGGAALTRDLATLFGADGYAETAGNALQEGLKMIGQLRKLDQEGTPK